MSEQKDKQKALNEIFKDKTPTFEQTFGKTFENLDKNIDRALEIISKLKK